MLSSELTQGRSYAWCDTPSIVSPPLLRVRFVGPARGGKAKIRWEQGDLDGLVEWVSTRQLISSWGERKRCILDREKQAALDRQSEAMFDRVVEDAISHVLTATGEEGGFQRSWALAPAKAERLWQRANLVGDPRNEPHAFVDRFGELHLGYASALRFAKAFAAAEPEPCLLLVEHWETELRAQGFLPGQSGDHEYLREERPAYALVRQWAGSTETELLRTEITRLQTLVYGQQRNFVRPGRTARP